VETKLVFGPLSWSIDLQTTSVPDSDLDSLTEMPDLDAVAITALPDEILFTEEVELVTDDVEEEVVEIVIEDIKKVVVEVEDGTIAGSTAMWTIMLSSCGLLSAGSFMLFKFYQNKKRENLISN